MQCVVLSCNALYCVVLCSGVLCFLACLGSCNALSSLVLFRRCRIVMDLVFGFDLDLKHGIGLGGLEQKTPQDKTSKTNNNKARKRNRGNGREDTTAAKLLKCNRSINFILTESWEIRSYF